MIQQVKNGNQMKMNKLFQIRRMVLQMLNL